jgi:photosystem II stability/assembly factor-like uncharacterized protein
MRARQNQIPIGNVQRANLSEVSSVNAAVKTNTMLRATLVTILLAASVSADGADPYAGWAVGNRTNGYGTVMRTTDSGTNWTRQGAGQIADVNLYGVLAVDASTAWTVGDPQSGYASVYRTTDGGTNWVRKGSLTSIPHSELTELKKVFASSAAQAWAVGGGTILHTSDGGDSWTNQIPTGYESIAFQGIYSPDGVNVWATGGSNNGFATILKSGDGGLTWLRQTNGDVFKAETLLGISAVDANSAWTVGGNPHGGYVVLHTGDGGSNWTEMYHLGLGDANEVSANASAVWVACDSQIMRSTNGAISWDSPSSPPYTMGISAVSSEEAWAVVNGETSSSGSILHTSDGGATWATQLSGKALAPLWTISIAHPPLPPLLSIFPLNAANGVLVIQLTAPTNHVYELQAASDCLSTNWQPTWVATNLTGSVLYTNSQADSGNQQFYRARVVR